MKKVEQRISLYADDVALFISPVEEEMQLTMGILDKFDEALGCQFWTRNSGNLMSCLGLRRLKTNYQDGKQP
jgi:hypothetical protein